MRKLANVIMVMLLPMAIVACSSSTAAENPGKEKASSPKLKTTDGEFAIHLTKEEFLSKVYNYELNKENWKYEGDKPAIIDFYADWCQPCKIASPILEELAEEYEGKIYVYKINTEKERELASAFGISSIPTFLLIPMGESPQIFSGIGQTPESTKEMFKQAIDEVLLKSKTDKEDERVTAN